MSENPATEPQPAPEPAPPAAAEAPTPAPAPVARSQPSLLSQKPVQFVLIGVLGLALGGIIGGGIGFAVGHHFGDGRGHHQQYGPQRKGDYYQQPQFRQGPGQNWPGQPPRVRMPIKPNQPSAAPSAS
jgi:hypothetical protein